MTDVDTLKQLRADLQEHWRPSRWPDREYGWQCKCRRCVYIRLEIVKAESRMKLQPKRKVICSAGWGLWDRGKKKWRTTNGRRQKFETRHAAERYKMSITQGIRKDPLIAYYRAFVSPQRLPNKISK